MPTGIPFDLLSDLQFDLPLDTSLFSFILTLAKMQAAGVGESLRKHLRAPLDRRRNPPPTKSLDTVLSCLSFCWRLVRRRRCPGRAALPPPQPPSLSLFPFATWHYQVRTITMVQTDTKAEPRNPYKVDFDKTFIS